MHIHCKYHLYTTYIDSNMNLCRSDHIDRIGLETCIYPNSDLRIICRHAWFDPSPPCYHQYQQHMFWNSMFYDTIVFHSILMLYDSRITRLILTTITTSSINLIALRHHINVCVSTTFVAQ